jgi:Ankyrin repeat
MDIVAKRRAREFTLLMLVSGMALIANLPERVLNMVDLDRGVIMAVLGVVVLIAVFLYVRMFFFLFYLLLAVGANLPEQWAEALNISQGPLLAALITMVAVSLVNYSAKVLPTGLEKRAKRANPEALQALFSAIDRGNPTHVRAVLSLDFDVNGAGADGLTPLMHVVQRGNVELLNMLVAHGADLSTKGPQGTVAEMALKAGRHELAKQISDHLSAGQKKLPDQPVNV